MKTAKLLIVSILLTAAIPAAAQTQHLGKSLDAWMAQLNSAERIDRLLAARAVGEMALAGMPGAAEAVFQSMDHSDSAVRYWAMVAAGRMDEAARPAEPRLRKALNDEAPEVRVWAAYALVRLGKTGEGVQALIREMDNPEKGARLQAVEALDELGADAKPATAVLQRATDDEFDYVQRVARHALWILGEQPCPYQECQ